MRAKAVNEFERGLPPEKSMNIGRENIKGDFDQHLEAVKKQRKNLSDEEKDIEDMQKTYVFIYRPAFIPVEIDGETLHKKYFEIENLYQVDKYDKGDLMSVGMMKMRARAQGDDGKIAQVVIPTFMHDKKTAYDSQIDDKLRKYIMKNKERI